LPFTGVMLFDDEPERECWHEAGHAIVGHHLGMTILAIGFSWVYGEDAAPNPSTWIPTDGFDKDIVGIELLAGVAAEIIKLGDYDIMACNADVQACRQVGCASSHEHYINQAIKILVEKNAPLVRVHKRLMEERVNPSYPPFVDTADHMKKQRHLTQEDFESLM